MSRLLASAIPFVVWHNQESDSYKTLLALFRTRSLCQNVDKVYFQNHKTFFSSILPIVEGYYYTIHIIKANNKLKFTMKSDAHSERKTQQTTITRDHRLPNKQLLATIHSIVGVLQSQNRIVWHNCHLQFQFSFSSSHTPQHTRFIDTPHNKPFAYDEKPCLRRTPEDILYTQKKRVNSRYTTTYMCDANLPKNQKWNKLPNVWDKKKNRSRLVIISHRAKRRDRWLATPTNRAPNDDRNCGMDEASGTHTVLMQCIMPC